MATSPRKHVVPAPGETPRRQVINDLAASINDFVPVANVTERAQLVADLTALDVGPSLARPLYVHRADAPDGFELEVDEGSGFYSVSGGSRFRYVTPTSSGTLTGQIDLAAAQTIPALPFGNRPYWLRITGAAVLSCLAPRRGIIETLIDGSTWDYDEVSAGAGSAQSGVRCTRPFLITNPAVTHTARVRISAPDGQITVLGPGRVFDIELTPATAL